MTALETYLATHLRYTVWATRRTLDAIRRLSTPEYRRDLGSGHRSVRGTLEHMFVADWGWYELLAGEPPGIAEAPDDSYYSVFENLENDYRTLLVKYEILASFLDDEELAARFAHTDVLVPWLETGIPKWQGVMNLVSHGTYHRGQLAALIRQLGHPPTDTDLVRFYLELEGKPWRYD